jgi:hypothetical protein
LRHTVYTWEKVTYEIWFRYPIDGDHTIEVPGSVRESCQEVLFERDLDQMSLPNMILDAIVKVGYCPLSRFISKTQLLRSFTTCRVMESKYLTWNSALLERDTKIHISWYTECLSVQYTECILMCWYTECQFTEE